MDWGQLMIDLDELIAEARAIAAHSAVSLPDHADCLTRLADALEAAASERAAVPDAATEQNECALPGHAGCTRVVVDGEPWFDHLPAERDAALAAIERVRAIHTPTLPGYGPKSCVHDGRAWPCATVAALGTNEGENE